jgi:hypothetical protein
VVAVEVVPEEKTVAAVIAGLPPPPPSPPSSEGSGQTDKNVEKVWHAMQTAYD